MNGVRSLAAVTMSVALCACWSGVSGAPPTQPAQGPAAPSSETVPAPLLEKVLRDAAERTGVPSSELEILSTERVIWSDGALGCPQPERMYTQAVVPGYRIRVRAPEQTLDYRVAETGRFVLCSPPQVNIDEEDIA